MAFSRLALIFFFVSAFMLANVFVSASNPLREDTCDADFFLPESDSNPFDDLQDRCASVKDALDSRWCSNEARYGISPFLSMNLLTFNLFSCTGDSVAQASVSILPVITVFTVNGVPRNITSTVTVFPGLGYAITATNFVLAVSAGGPGISRGTIDFHVDIFDV